MQTITLLERIDYYSLRENQLIMPDSSLKIPIKKLKINPKNDLNYYNLAIQFAKKNEFEKSKAYFKKDIEINSDNDKSYFNLAYIYGLQENYEEAEKQYKQAIQHNSESSTAYFNLGQLSYDRKKYNEAKKYITSAIEIDNNPKYNLFLSNINKQLNNYILSLKNMVDNLGITKIDLKIFNKIETPRYEEIFAQAQNYNSEVQDIILKTRQYMLEEVGVLYAELIKLMVNINNFKESLLVRPSDKVETFYQYTSLDTLKSMLKLNQQCNTSKVSIRLYNTDYMNDPEEGKFFIQKLKNGGSGMLLNSKYSVSHAFISSLTSAKDEIPMWSMYGDDSKGISIGFTNLPIIPNKENNSEINDSDIQEFSDDLDSTGNPNQYLQYPYIEEEARLYKVYYIDSEEDWNIEELKNIQGAINKISQCFKDNEPTKTFLHDAVSKFISVELDRIKFLIKNITMNKNIEF